MGILIVLAAAVVVGGAVWLLRRGRWYRRMAGALLGLVGVLGLMVGGYWTWFTHRGQPAPLREEWFRGVRYERIVRQEPRPMVAHLVTIDLRTPGLRIVLTPPDVYKPPMTADDRPLRARTTSTFAREHELQFAINANLFYPFRGGNPVTSYPRAGDPVQVTGIGATEGKVYAGGPSQYGATLFFTERGTASFELPNERLWGAISGYWWVVRDGKAYRPPDRSNTPMAEVDVGLDEKCETMLILVTDANQPSYSDGVTHQEQAEILVAHGAHDAISLDGGGSSTLVRQTTPDRWELVNCPNNYRIPWCERPVANHLGFRISADAGTGADSPLPVGPPPPASSRTDTAPR